MLMGGLSFNERKDYNLTMDISLALGGGGAKGFSHIGVLKVLKREGFNIRAIAGTSAGGLIGALYLVGNSPDEIVNELVELDQKDFYGHAPGEQPSLLGLAGITKYLTKEIGDMTFDELPIPFAVTSVDLNSGESVILREGSLLEAVLATIAVPGILPPRLRGNQLLVDGGVSNPVPVNITRELSPNTPVLAVVLSQKPGSPSEPAHLQLETESSIIERITRLKVAQALNIFLRSLDVSSRLLAEMRLEIDKPEIIIRPDVSNIGLLDRVDIKDIMTLGEISVEDQLENIFDAVKWSSRLRKKISMENLLKQVLRKEFS